MSYNNRCNLRLNGIEVFPLADEFQTNIEKEPPKVNYAKDINVNKVEQTGSGSNKKTNWYDRRLKGSGEKYNASGSGKKKKKKKKLLPVEEMKYNIMKMQKRKYSKKLKNILHDKNIF